MEEVVKDQDSYACTTCPSSFIISLIIHFLITDSFCFDMCLATRRQERTTNSEQTTRIDRLQKLNYIQLKSKGTHTYVRLIATQLMRAFNCYLDLITRSCDLVSYCLTTAN